MRFRQKPRSDTALHLIESIAGCSTLRRSAITQRFAWRLREFGLALQTVNVIRGLRKDYERGWIFVPESFCAAVNLRRSDLFKPEYQIQALQVVDMVADKAEGHLQKALAYVMALPPWLHTLRLACIWPMLFAVRTLALSRQNVNVLVGEVKMTREEVKAIVRDTTLFGWSNRWLESYYEQLKVVRRRPAAPTGGAAAKPPALAKA